MQSNTERPKKISTLLAEAKSSLVGAAGDIEVTAIETDSRKVMPGSLFVAIAGDTVDGHDFIGQAVKNGCVAVVGEKKRTFEMSVPFVEVEDSREALSKIALSFYGDPSKDLILVGITGTNGKTTATYLIEAIIRVGGGNPAVIGTVNYRFNGEEHPAPFTTPEPVLLQKLIREMVRGGVTHLIMEVSSHSLIQKRIHGLQFHVALFTNLSRDHLDFHGTMRDYFEAKKILFEKHVKKGGASLFLCDRVAEGGEPDWGGIMIDELQAAQKNRPEKEQIQIISCGLKKGNDLYVSQFSYDLSGVVASVYVQGDAIRVQSSMVGEFNLKNILGAVGVAHALGVNGDVISKGIAELKNVPGRLERVTFATDSEATNEKGNCHKCTIFVDYAHTPDALKNVLKTMRKIAPQRIIVVFGCGGDRDIGKRSIMGEVAGFWADIVVVTTDNPRSESPFLIMAEIEKGVVASGAEKITLSDNNDIGYLLIADRAEAIKYAVSVAKKDDVVLIAGKGHEDYQIIGKKRIFFDDRIEARKQLELLCRQAA